MMADVQGCPVHRFEVANSAVLGAALRAVHGYLLASGSETAWEAVVSGLVEPVPGSAIEPAEGAREVYDGLVQKYAECEKAVTGVR